MKNHLEIEFKILLSASLYQQILQDFQSTIIHQYEQTNYYLMHPILEAHRYMLRIREKEGQYELTLKEPKEIGNLETNIALTKEEAIAILNHQSMSNSIFQKLEALHIPIHEISTTHSLQTYRNDIQHPLGILSLDKNIYEGITDYELEFEVTDYHQGKQAFLHLLKMYHLSYQENCPSKIQRLQQVL